MSGQLSRAVEEAGEARVQVTALGLTRPRLHRDHDDASIVVAYGPAGCGKTTFLQQHAARWPGPVVWLECDGFTQTLPAFAKRLGQHVGSDDDPFERLGLGHELIVIDDVDRLPHETADGIVGALVGRLPPGCAIAIGTRQLDALADLERWRVAGKLRTVDSHDLRFRLWEVERLFRDVYLRPLSVDDLHLVASASGGWPVALYYFGVALRQDASADASHVVAQVGRSNLRLRRYLRSQVLRSLPTWQRRSLRRLAVFDRLDRTRVDMFAPDLSDVLLDLVGVGVLEENPSDGSLRMHSLLRAELVDELAGELSDAEIRSLYADAAVVLERVGESHEAALARARAGGPTMSGPSSDAVALHAAANLDLFAGDTHRAARQLEAAVALFDQEGGNTVATRQLRLLTDWLTGSRGEPTNWVAAIRMVLAGRRAPWTGPNADLVAATTLLVAGEIEQAHRAFVGAEHATQDRNVATVAGLGAGLSALLAGRRGLAATCGRRAWTRCRDDSADALALIAEALMLSDDGAPGDIESLTELADRRDDVLVTVVVHLIAAEVQPARSTRANRHRLAATMAAEADDMAGVVAVARRPATTSLAAPPKLDRRRKTSDPTVTITCIGRFTVRVGGREADLDQLRPKHRELLAVLTARPGVPHHREELVDALWPRRSLDDAKPVLHTAVSAVRGWLEAQGDPSGRERLQRRGDAYVLLVPASATDLGVLLEHCASAIDAIRSRGPAVDDLREVIDRYHDEPFRSFGPVEWAVNTREATRAVVEDLVTTVERALGGVSREARPEFHGVLRRAAARCGLPLRVGPERQVGATLN